MATLTVLASLSGIDVAARPQRQSKRGGAKAHRPSFATLVTRAPRVPKGAAEAHRNGAPLFLFDGIYLTLHLKLVASGGL